jgi:hypothetical protein
MDKKKLIYLVGGIVILFLAFLIFKGDSEEKDTVTQKDKKSDTWKTQSSDGNSFSNFPDAPRPEMSEDEKEVSKLWPHALEPQDPKLKEKVKKEWQDFSRKYPDNIYIPHEIRGVSLTESEERNIIETLDSFTSVDAQFASFAAANKYAAPGTEAPAGMNEKDANPKEMKQYFDYKIRELESRIQLIEYTMEKSRLSSISEETAKADIKTWQKEIANLKEVQSQIPKS